MVTLQMKFDFKYLMCPYNTVSAQMFLKPCIKPVTEMTLKVKHVYCVGHDVSLSHCHCTSGFKSF